MKKPLIYLYLVVILAGAFQTNTIAAGEPVAEINILPTPKLMEPTGERFLLNESGKPSAMIIIDRNDEKAVVAAEEINDRIKALGGKPLPLVEDASSEGTPSSSSNTIQFVVLDEMQSDSIPVELQDAMNFVSSKGEQGYAIRFAPKPDRGKTAVLAGAGWKGMLYAGSTFRLLIRKEDGKIFATEVQVTDWPDFKNRGLPVWPLPRSFDDFKKYVDWALRYKFNSIYTYTTREKTADGFNLPTSKERLYLRMINTYAKERGIKINYTLTWGVASVSPEGSKGDYGGAVLFNKQYYTWGDDVLLQKRASDIARFAKDTETDSLLFHCIDTHEEAWGKRGKPDRARFGNDRASADANVINIFTRDIRRTNPGIELQFVVYPYRVNFALPGNEHYKAWMTKLTGLIPHDVYLTVAEFNKDRTDSWVAVVRQPLVHWINGYAFQWGRYFSTLPAFTKTAYYEGRNRDILIHWEPIGYFNGEVMQLIAAEYEWNIGAPGSGYIIEEKTGKINVGGGNLHYRKETVNGADTDSWAWHNGTSEPKPTSEDLLLKACRLEFGETAAPFIADFFKNNPIGWRDPDLFSRVLLATATGNELEACSDQLTKVNYAIVSLTKALQSDINDGVRTRLNIFLKHAYCQAFAITGATSSYKAMKLLSEGFSLEALRELNKGRDQLKDMKREMEQRAVWSKEMLPWFETGLSRLKTAEATLKKDGASNLLINAGFEEPGTAFGRQKEFAPHWSSVGSVVLSTDYHGGKYAANLKLSTGDKSVFIEQPFTVPRECQGFVEFWMKKDGDFRVIPIFQYWDESRTKKTEDLAANDFPFSKPVPNYARFRGRFRFPPHVTQAVFKIYADWEGFTPVLERNIYFDAAFIGCLARE